MSEGISAGPAAAGNSSGNNSTGTIALVVAGLLLLVVGGMAYKDYVESKYEKEFADRAQQQQVQGGYPQGQGQQPYNQGQQNGQPGFNNQMNGGQPVNGNFQQNPNGGQTFQGQQPAKFAQNTQGYQNNPQQFQQQQPQPQNFNGNSQVAGANPNGLPPGGQFQNQQQPPQGISGSNTGQNGGPFNPFDNTNQGTTAAESQNDPDLEAARRAMEQRRQERLIAEEQMRKLKGGGSVDIPSAPGIATSDPQVPSFNNLGSAVTAAKRVTGEVPAGAVPPSATGSQDPAAMVPAPAAFGQELLESIDPRIVDALEPEQLQKLKQELVQDAEQVKRIAESPAIAKVIHVDKEYDVVTLNGGADRNIKLDSVFTVRRGNAIVATVTIVEVDQNQSAAKVEAPRGNRADMRFPKVGDELIPEKLF